MRTLLDKPTQRTIQLIEYLSESRDWLTIKKLSILTNSSERTIADDISTIKKRWGSYLDIKISSKNGIQIMNPNISKMGKVITDLLNESTALKLLESILLYPRNKIEFHEQRLFASHSTLLRLIPKINNYLKEREIWIEHRDNLYELRGNEEQYLRQFFACFLLELHGLTLKDTMENFDISILGQTLGLLFTQNLSGEEDYVLGDTISVVFYIMFYLVSLARENDGYCINTLPTVDFELPTHSYEYIKSYFPNITRNHLVPIHSFILNMYIGWDSKKEETLVNESIHAFFKRIFDFIQVTPQKQVLDHLFFILKAHYLTAKSRPYQTSALFDRIHYFAISLKKNNEALYQLVKHNLDIFSNDIHFDMLPRLDDILFWTCLNYPELSKVSISKSALVISDFGKQHANYLAQFFDSYFNTSNNTLLKTTSCDFLEIPTLSLTEYNFLITTIPDLPVKHNRVILVNDYPSTENLFEIHNALFSH